MSAKEPDNVVVATQFSRLCGERAQEREFTREELGYEALSALSESMQLLSEALGSLSTQRTWDDSRRERLNDRVTGLMRQLGRNTQR